MTKDLRTSFQGTSRTKSLVSRASVISAKLTPKRRRVGTLKVGEMQVRSEG